MVDAAGELRSPDPPQEAPPDTALQPPDEADHAADGEGLGEVTPSTQLIEKMQTTPQHESWPELLSSHVLKTLVVPTPTKHPPNHGPSRCSIERNPYQAPASPSSDSSGVSTTTSVAKTREADVGGVNGVIFLTFFEVYSLKIQVFDSTPFRNHTAENKTRLPMVLLLVFLVLGSSASKLPPNIIFMLVDGLGWDDVSFHGSPQIPTPNMDALAADGIILNNYYVQPVCTQSRAALMTGMYPIHTGLQHGVLLAAEPNGLPLEFKIMPEYFKDLGYETHLIGKWNLGYYMKEYTPTYRGFDSFYGFYNYEEDYFTHNLEFEGHIGLDFWLNTEPVLGENGNYSTHLYTERAKFLIANRDVSKPFFLYLSHQSVHGASGNDPLQAPEENIAKFPYIGDERRTKYAGLGGKNQPIKARSLFFAAHGKCFQVSMAHKPAGASSFSFKVSTAYKQASTSSFFLKGLQHGVLLAAEPNGLPLEFKIMPEYFKDLGYETHLIGKWNLGYYMKEYTPTYRGFDSFYGFYNYEEDYFTHNLEFEGHIGLDFWLNTEPVLGENGNYSTHLYTERAKFLIANRDVSKPFFLYLSHQSVHGASGNDPLQAPEENIAKFPYIGDERRTKYAGMVDALDESAGDVLEALYEAGMLANTIIVMSSANGGLSSGVESNGGSNFPLRGGKGALWEGGTRASAFIWTPLLYQKNRVSDQMMHITDWLPTLYAAARSEENDQRLETPGNSRPYRDLDIAMALSKAARVLRNFHNRGILFMDSNWRQKAALNCGDDERKNFVPGAPPYLFDLAKDPCEMSNIALKEPGAHSNDTFERTSPIVVRPIAFFSGMVDALDESAGDVLEALYGAGMLANTIIVMSSANGGLSSGVESNAGSNFPLRGGKGALWEGGTRASAFIWSPLLYQKNRVSDQMMHITDWLPTLYAAAQGNPFNLGTLDGQNLWNHLSYNLPSPRYELLYNIDPIDQTSAIRFLNYKLVLGESSGSEENDHRLKTPGNSRPYRDLDIAMAQSKAARVLRNFHNRGILFMDSNWRQKAALNCGDDERENVVPGAPPYLFDLAKDPCEMRNIVLIEPGVSLRQWSSL
ncbi:arylsulfatase B [Ixodes scapularis]